MSLGQRGQTTDSEVPDIWLNDELIRFALSYARFTCRFNLWRA